MLAYVLIAWLLGVTIAGWTSLMAVVLLLGRAQLFVISLLGEYVGRSYIEAKRRPLFIIERIVRAGQSTELRMTVPVDRIQLNGVQDRPRGADE